MTAGLQLTLEDELHRIVLANRRAKLYARSLARLDLQHEAEALAAEDAERMAGPRAATCSCGPRAWGEPSEGRCCRCGHALEAAQS